LFPGLVLVAMYLLYLAGVAVFRPDKAPPISRDEARSVLTRGLVLQFAISLAAPLILIVAVLGSILGGVASPTEAASVGAVGALMLAGYRAAPRQGRGILLAGAALAGLLVLAQLFDLRIQRTHIEKSNLLAICAALMLVGFLVFGLIQAILRTFFQSTEDESSVLLAVMRSTTMITSMVFMILIGATMFSLVFRGFGGDLWIEAFLLDLPGGFLMAMLVVMGVMFVLGFFLDFLEIVFIVVPIVAPVLLQMEMPGGGLVSPVWLGVMIAINLQTSFLTPPFGFALFYLRGVAPARVTTGEIYCGVIPFVLIQLLVLVVLWFSPEIATWLPGWLYGP